MADPIDLPAGGTVPFSFTVKKDGVVVDISGASEVKVALITRTQPRTLIGTAVTATSGAVGADWENGVVAGVFENENTSAITHRGHADIQVKVTTGGEPEFYFAEKAVDIIDVVSV